MDSKQLTNNRFGKWGWSMIIYTLLLYYIYAGLCVDSMNLYPDAFAGLYGMDRNLLLGLASAAPGLDTNPCNRRRSSHPATASRRGRHRSQAPQPCRRRSL